MNLHKVSQVSKELGFSKVTIYKKLKIFHRELKPYIKVRGNVKYISQEGVDFLKKVLEVEDKPTIFEGDSSHSHSTFNEEDRTKFLDKINSLTEEIQFLNTQLKEKENLILNQSLQLQNLYASLKKEKEKASAEENKKLSSFRLFGNK